MRFMCLKCAEGCETCVDSTPCLFSSSLLVRLILMICTVAEVALIAATSVVVSLCKERRVCLISVYIFSLNMECIVLGSKYQGMDHKNDSVINHIYTATKIQVYYQPVYTKLTYLYFVCMLYPKMHLDTEFRKLFSGRNS